MDASSLKFYANRRINALKTYKTGFSTGAVFCFGGAIWLEESNPIKPVLGLLIVACLWATYQCNNQIKSLNIANEELSNSSDEYPYQYKVESIQYQTSKPLFRIVKG